MRGVLRCDAEPPRRDLLDPRVALVPETRRILAALAAVRAPAEAVEGDRDRLVRLRRERAVRHATAREAPQDRLDRLDLVDRHGRACGDKLEQIARLERHAPVDERGEAAVLLGAAAAVDGPAERMRGRDGLQRLGHLRRRRMRLAARPVLDVPRALELACCRAACAQLALELGEADATERGRRACEAELGHLGREAERFEELRAAVRGHVGDPHLRHHLENAVLEGGAEAALRLLRRRVVAAEAVCAGECRHRLEREPGTDGVGAVAEQAGEVMAVTRLVADHYERDERPAPRRDEPLLDGAEGEQARNRDRRILVGEHEDVGSAVDERGGLRGEPPAGPVEALAGVESSREPDPAQLVQDRGVEEKALQLEQVRRCGTLAQQRLAPADQRPQ